MLGEPDETNIDILTLTGMLDLLSVALPSNSTVPTRPNSAGLTETRPAIDPTQAIAPQSPVIPLAGNAAAGSTPAVESAGPGAMSAAAVPSAEAQPAPAPAPAATVAPEAAETSQNPGCGRNATGI